MHFRSLKQRGGFGAHHRSHHRESNACCWRHLAHDLTRFTELDCQIGTTAWAAKTSQTGCPFFSVSSLGSKIHFEFHEPIFPGQGERHSNLCANQRIGRLWLEACNKWRDSVSMQDPVFRGQSDLRAFGTTWNGRKNPLAISC